MKVKDTQSPYVGGVDPAGMKGRKMVAKTLCTGLIMVLIDLLCAGQIQAAEWKQYALDSEGKQYYDKATVTQPSPGIISVTTSVLYSEEGKKLYLGRRQKSGMSNGGFDKLHYRVVRHEVNCFSAAKEFTMLEVWELSHDGRTLDYARAGNPKEWMAIPQESHLEQLYKIICPAKR